MAVTITLDDHIQKAVEGLVQSGQFASGAEVVARGVRLVQEQEARVRAFDAAILEGWEQSRGDDMVELDAGFDAIEAKWRARIKGQAA